MVAKKIAQKSGKQAPSQGLFANTGNGPTLQPIDIGHPDWFALVDPDTAFWSLVKRENLAETLTKGPLLTAYRKNSPKRLPKAPS